MGISRTLTFLVATLMLTGFVRASAAQQQEAAPVFAGQYDQLRDEQKLLVDDWFHRFSETIEKPVDAAEGYNNLPLSVKTTFNAVTHALLKTSMTDASNAVLGESAIQIIDKVDSVAGKISGAGGDRQFRIYVQLKPGAIELLDKSREFKRGPDNTVYHKGYPVCYRSTGGTPSIQVSATRDGTRADVDVDYRSSKFPVFLINGHLSASNSDVRSGDNIDRHNSHWSGLQNWWRNLLGLPVFNDGDVTEDKSLEEDAIPRTPKVTAKDKPYVAVHDFLNSWLVEQKPNLALSYFSEQAYACIEVERGEPVDRGMAKFSMLKALQNANRQIGTVSSLSDAIQGVRLTGPRGKVIQQPYHAQFVFYDVREDLAAMFDCSAKLDPGIASAKALRSHKFGKYYGALFYLKEGEKAGAPIATIWKEENGYWKLVSFDVDPQSEDYKVPDLAARPAPPVITTVKGDPQMIRAGKDFMEKWFIRGQIDRAFEYLTPQSYSCLNLYRSDETPAAGTLEEAGTMIRQAMERLSTTAGKVKRIEEAVVAPDPGNEEIRIVRHSESNAYIIASIPDYMGEGADCSNRQRGEDPVFRKPENIAYGNYYALGFRLAASTEDGGVLWIVWHKEDREWKIVSYLVLTP